jgi:hypothetical protein
MEKEEHEFTLSVSSAAMPCKHIRHNQDMEGLLNCCILLSFDAHPPASQVLEKLEVIS